MFPARGVNGIGVTLNVCDAASGRTCDQTDPHTLHWSGSQAFTAQVCSWAERFFLHVKRLVLLDGFCAGAAGWTTAVGRLLREGLVQIFLVVLAQPPLFSPTGRTAALSCSSASGSDKCCWSANCNRP